MHSNISQKEKDLQLLKNADLFGNVVSRSYLGELANSEIIKLDKSIEHTSIRWYSVTKIVLEKDSS